VVNREHSPFAAAASERAPLLHCKQCLSAGKHAGDDARSDTKRVTGIATQPSASEASCGSKRNVCLTGPEHVAILIVSHMTLII